jgi:hypothetical protein
MSNDRSLEVWNELIARLTMQAEALKQVTAKRKAFEQYVQELEQPPEPPTVPRSVKNCTCPYCLASR